LAEQLRDGQDDHDDQRDDSEQEREHNECEHWQHEISSAAQTALPEDEGLA
jgi:hypothetical protein